MTVIGQQQTTFIVGAKSGNDVGEKIKKNEKTSDSDKTIKLAEKGLDITLNALGATGKGIDKSSDALGSGLKSIKKAFHKVIRVILAAEIIKTGLKNTSRTEDEAEKRRILGATLTKIEEKGVDRVLERLKIGKKVDLAGTIQRLKMDLQNPDNKDAIQQTEEVLATLKSRSIKMFALSMIQAVMSTVAIAAIILGTLIAAAAASPALWIVGIASASTAALAFGAEYFLVTSNPFDPNCKSRLVRIIDFFKNI